MSDLLEEARDQAAALKMAGMIFIGFACLFIGGLIALFVLAVR